MLNKDFKITTNAFSINAVALQDDKFHFVIVRSEDHNAIAVEMTRKEIGELIYMLNAVR